MSSDHPKPGPFRPKHPVQPVKKPDAKQAPKKPYVPKPHLTNRPFSDDELLAKLIKDTGVENKPDPHGPYSDEALFNKLRTEAAEQESNK